MTKGARLPSRRLRSAASGAEVNVRRGRGPVVVLKTHSAECDGCVEYARGLVAEAERVTGWGGRILVVVSEASAASAHLAAAGAGAGGAVQVLEDPESRVVTGTAAVAVADEWGEVHFEADSGEGHGLPDPQELAEWVRFLAIQCPECEGPEGPWRTISAAGA